jgi:glycopeptide antibiotics resistance protein
LIRSFLQAGWLRSRITAIAWWLIMCVLFILPGSAFPKQNWFSAVYFDKWIHFGLFMGLVFLWSSAFDYFSSRTKMTLLYAFIFGIVVEVVQQLFVSNRSFDVIDILTDVTGALAGVMLFRWVYKKNKPL